MEGAGTAVAFLVCVHGSGCYEGEPLSRHKQKASLRI